MFLSNNVNRVAWFCVLLHTTLARDVAPLVEATCSCDNPLQDRRYVCTNGVVGFCDADEHCFREQPFPFTERGAQSCMKTTNVVSCTCATPGAGTIDFNRIDCTNGESHFCGVTEECFRTGNVAIQERSALCRNRAMPRPMCQNGDVRMESYPAGRIDIYQNGEWYPLCAHQFHDNNQGASRVCEALGYESGTLLADGNTFQRPAFEIGTCQPGQSRSSCLSSGAQAFTERCARGQAVGISATCVNPGQIFGEDKECDDTVGAFRSPITVFISTSESNSVTRQVGDGSLECPRYVNRENRIPKDGFGDLFEITVGGLRQDLVTARRIDADGGWSIALAFQCTIAKFPVTPNAATYNVGDPIKITWGYDSTRDGGDRIAIYPTTSVEGEGTFAPLDSQMWTFTCGGQSCDEASVTCAAGQQCTKTFTFGAGGIEESGSETWPLSAGEYTAVLLENNSQTILSRSSSFTVLEQFQPLTRTVFLKGLTELSGGNDNNARNLRACIGECDSDAQCAPGLECYQRSNGEPIPGCKGNGANPEADYCYDPNLLPPRTELSGGNDDNAINLRACIGECDSDLQCAPGLKCFQRSFGETIPGCKGSGGSPDSDYCYDPNLVSRVNTRFSRNGQGVVVALTERDTCATSGYQTIDNEDDCSHFCQRSYGNFGAGEYSAAPGCFVVVGGIHKNNCHWNRRENARNNFDARTLCYTPATLRDVNTFGGSGCFLRDVRYTGPNIPTNLGAASPQGCQRNCLNNAWCEFWTWNPSNNFCFFWGADANGYESNPSTVGLWSGPRRGCHGGDDGTYYDIVIGTSDGNTKTVTAPVSGFRCPPVVNHNNWAAPVGDFENEYAVTVSGSQVTVFRTDKDASWADNIVLRCEKVETPHKESNCYKHGRIRGDCCGLEDEISCNQGYILARPLRPDVCDNIVCGGACVNPGVRAFRCIPVPEEKGWQQPEFESMSCVGERVYHGQIGLAECQKRCELDPMCRSIFGALDYGDRTCWTCQDYNPRRARVPEDVNHSRATNPTFYRSWELKREARWSFAAFSTETTCPPGFEAVTRAECELLGRSIISEDVRSARGVVDDNSLSSGCTIGHIVTNANEAIPRWSTNNERFPGRRLVCKHVVPTDALVSLGGAQFRAPVVSGGAYDTLINGERCVDGNIATYCRSQPSTDAYLEFDLESPLVVMRVWIANRGDSNVAALGRFNIKVHDGNVWQNCIEAHHISTVLQWTEVICHEAVLGHSIRIELSNRMEEASITIADVRVQGITPQNARMHDPRYTEIDGVQACDEMAIVKDLSCPSGADPRDCVQLGKQECENHGLNCWGFGITDRDASAVAAIQIYDRRAPKPFTCSGEMGLRYQRQWTTYVRTYKQFADVVVYDRACYTYNFASDTLETKLTCNAAQRELAETTIATFRNQTRPCIFKTGADRTACIQETEFRRQIGELQYDIFHKQRNITRFNCTRTQQRGRRRAEEVLAEWQAKDDKSTLASRLAGNRRRLMPQSECRRRAQVNNDNACNNLKDASDLTVQLYQDQVALQQREVERLKRERAETIANGAFGLFGDVLNVGFAAFSNPMAVFSAGTSLVSNAISYGFAIDDANKEIEFAREEVELLRREGDIEALRDLSDLVQTCDQASTDDLGCGLEELSDRIDDRFFTIIETSQRNHIEVMNALAAQNQVIERTTMVLEEILEVASQTLTLAEQSQDILLNFGLALEDIVDARNTFEELTGPNAVRELTLTADRFNWCPFVNKMGGVQVLDSIARWVTSDLFFELHMPDDASRRDDEAGVITRCELEEWKRLYTREFRSLVAVFDYAVTIRKYTLEWRGSYDLITFLRNAMATNYVERVQQIDDTTTTATRCVGDFPITCPADSHPTHGPQRDPFTRDTQAEPVTREPCETNQCTCEHGTGVLTDCLVNNAMDCTACDVGYHLEPVPNLPGVKHCYPDRPTCSNGTPAQVHHETIVHPDLAGKSCMDAGFTNPTTEDECRRLCELRGPRGYSGRVGRPYNLRGSQCFLYTSGPNKDKCQWLERGNGRDREPTIRALCNRPAATGHHQIENCGSCNPGYFLKDQETTTRRYQRCEAARCPCAKNGQGFTGDVDSNRCPAAFRIDPEFGRSEQDVHHSQCRECHGDREIVTFSGFNPDGVRNAVNSYCFPRNIGFIVFSQENYQGVRETIAPHLQRIDMGWMWMRSLIIFPGYCAEIREHRSDWTGYYFALYCNCDTAARAARRAIGFPNFNAPDIGFRRIKRWTCENAPDVVRDFTDSQATTVFEATTVHWTPGLLPRTKHYHLHYEDIIRDGKLIEPIERTSEF